MKCPQCKLLEARVDSILGVLPCLNCATPNTKPSRQVEFTTDNIRSQRRERRSSTLQPFRDNVLSKEFLEEHGTVGLDVTDEDIKNSEYVWSDLPGIEDRDKSLGTRGEEYKQKNIDANLRKK